MNESLNGLNAKDKEVFINCLKQLFLFLKFIVKYAYLALFVTWDW